MKTVGILKKMDHLGRIVIPINMRRTFNWDETTDIEISADEQGVHLKTHDSVCVFCGSTEHLQDFETKLVCKNCITRLQK